MRQYLTVFLIFMTSVLAGDNEIRNFEFPEDCCISIPKDWVVSMGGEFEKKGDAVKADKSKPSDFVIPKFKHLLSVKYPDEKQASLISLAVSPKEMTQVELANLSKEKKDQIYNLMKDQFTTALTSQKYKNIEISPPIIEKVNAYSCFRLNFKYETEKDNISHAEWRYFFLERGTFVLNITSNQAFLDKNKDLVDKILKSLEIK